MNHLKEEIYLGRNYNLQQTSDDIQEIKDA